MEVLLPNQQQFLDRNFENPHNFRNSSGGHMAYRRFLFDDSEGQTYFVKSHDPAMVVEDWRREEMLYFLEKEARVYKHLQDNEFLHIPELIVFDEGMLVLEGLSKQQGWHWRLPDDDELKSSYIEDTVRALHDLESTPPLPNIEVDEISVDTFYNHGWDKLHDMDIAEIINNNLSRWQEVLHTETPREALTMLQNIGDLAIKRVDVSKNIFNHHDARQSNIAWHPKKGAKIVDWSWADGGISLGDKTMFLLDLHKSGIDITKYTGSINPIYAQLMLGYWLQRSQTPHMEGNDGVRLQQFVSAIKASQFLTSHQKLKQTN